MIPSISIGQMLEQINGMRGTKDLNGWEDRFVGDVYAKYAANAKDTKVLSGKQAEIVQRIWQAQR